MDVLDELFKSFEQRLEEKLAWNQSAYRAETVIART